MKYFSLSFAVSLLGIVFSVSAAGYDSLWLYPNDFFQNISVRDTSSDNIVYHPKADTGDTLQGEYINYNYQFTDGWAGFKVLWNYGAAFDPEIFLVDTFVQFDSLIFYYKGPLPTHTVTVSFGSSGGCGDPVVYDDIGTLSSKSSWTRAAFLIPSVLKTRAQSQMFARELRFLFHNSAGVTGPTSAPGNFKIDNLVLVKSSMAGIKTPFTSHSSTSNRLYFIPGSNGAVELRVYSAQGALLGDKTIGVFAGKRYGVRDFALKNSGISAPRMYMVKIRGDGILITKTLWR